MRRFGHRSVLGAAATMTLSQLLSQPEQIGASQCGHLRWQLSGFSGQADENDGTIAVPPFSPAKPPDSQKRQVNPSEQPTAQPGLPHPLEVVNQVMLNSPQARSLHRSLFLALAAGNAGLSATKAQELAQVVAEFQEGNVTVEESGVKKESMSDKEEPRDTLEASLEKLQAGVGASSRVLPTSARVLPPLLPLEAVIIDTAFEAPNFPLCLLHQSTQVSTEDLRLSELVKPRLFSVSGEKSLTTAVTRQQLEDAEDQLAMELVQTYSQQDSVQWKLQKQAVAAAVVRAAERLGLRLELLSPIGSTHSSTASAFLLEEDSFKETLASQKLETQRSSQVKVVTSSGRAAKNKKDGTTSHRTPRKSLGDYANVSIRVVPPPLFGYTAEQVGGGEQTVDESENERKEQLHEMLNLRTQVVNSISALVSRRNNNFSADSPATADNKLDAFSACAVAFETLKKLSSATNSTKDAEFVEFKYCYNTYSVGFKGSLVDAAVLLPSAKSDQGMAGNENATRGAGVSALLSEEVLRELNSHALTSSESSTTAHPLAQPVMPFPYRIQLRLKRQELHGAIKPSSTFDSTLEMPHQHDVK